MALDSTQLVETIRQGACEHLAGIVLDPEGFRNSLAHIGAADLSANFVNFAGLIDILSAQSPSPADIALPTLRDLAAMCHIEAARRGLVLHQGNGKSGLLVAKLIAERLLDRPLPDLPANPAPH